MSYPESFDELESWRDELRRTVSGGDLIRAIEGRIESESDPVRLRILKIFLADEHIAQGNEAAAATIRAKDPIEEIHCWHAEWRQANGSADIIPILKSMISRESHPMKINALRYFLANEYRDNGDYAASSAVYLDEFNDDPSEPMPLITLAGQKKYLGRTSPRRRCASSIRRLMSRFDLAPFGGWLWDSKPGSVCVSTPIAPSRTH
jgi:hypothetical protein